MVFKRRDPNEDMKIKLTMFLWGFLSFLSLVIISNIEKIFGFIMSLFR